MISKDENRQVYAYDSHLELLLPLQDLHTRSKQEESYPLFRIQDESQPPYQSVGLLFFSNREGCPIVGTAFQIDSQLLLTSAHNCYSCQHKE